MELVNATRMQAAYTLGMEPSGRESVVVVVKGTFTFPDAEVEARLADEQVPLVMADEFTAEPGFSAPLYESDFAPHKPRCDVILNGSAYAPGGRPAERVDVSLKVGSLSKSFAVLGDRTWIARLTGLQPSPPRPFASLPITYDRAFGGVHPSEKDPDQWVTYRQNPVGKGFYVGKNLKAIIGRPLCNTQETGSPISQMDGQYRPMSFGPIGRSWIPRPSLAGTYDQKWLDEVFPFLPSDFDPLYHQCAPADQQMMPPQGGEEVELVHLTREGRTRFRLPRMEVPVEFTTSESVRTEVRATLDTVVIEPDRRLLFLVWRASFALKKNVFELAQAVVGRKSRAWYRARDVCKTYHPSVAHLIKSRRRGARPQ